MDKQPIQLKTSQILWPILIGTIVIIWMFLKEFDITALSQLTFNWQSVLFVFLACTLILVRDLGMVIRFRLMTNFELTWIQAIRVNILREFAASVLPTAIGGGGLIILFLNKEGINAGRSTTIAIINLFLDNLFFVFTCLLLFLLVPFDELFNNSSPIASSIGVIFWTVAPFLTIWTGLLYIGLFHRPDLIARFFKAIFRIKFLRKWEHYINTFTDNMVAASIEIGQRPFIFWLQSFGATALTWSARFFVVNMLFMAFTNVQNQLIIFGRQLMLWLITIVSPTPGGSGLSEIAFSEYYNDMALNSGAILVIVCVWRLISYYAYLFVGLFVVPGWVQRSFKKTDKAKIAEPDSESNNLTKNQL